MRPEGKKKFLTQSQTGPLILGYMIENVNPGLLLPPYPVVLGDDWAICYFV